MARGVGDDGGGCMGDRIDLPPDFIAHDAYGGIAWGIAPPRHKRAPTVKFGAKKNPPRFHGGLA